MVKKTLQKNTFREIRQSLGRFLAITAIIALGVGFFVGLKVTTTAMLTTGDTYYKECNLYDFRLLTTIGIDKEDLSEIANLDFVKAAEGAYSTDALVVTGEGTQVAAKLFSYSDQINKVTLTAGRLPENAGECLADAGWYTEDQIGETITISSENEEDTLDMLEEDELTIVGLCKAVTYINFERGTTGLGSGKLTGFLVVLPQEFTCDYYTEIYAVTDASELTAYTQAYDDLIDAESDILEDKMDELALKRYNRLYSEAEDKIDDAQAEMDDADIQISDAEQEVADAEEEIAENEQKLADAENDLADAEEEIAENEQKLEDGEGEIEDAQAELEDGKQELATAKNDYYTAVNTLDQQKEQLNALKAQVAQLPEYMQALYADRIALAEAQINAAGDQLNKARAEIEANEQKLADAEAEINTHRQEIIDGRKEIADAKVELEDGRQEIADGRTELEDGKTKLADAREELAEHESELEDAKVKLADARKELEDFTEPTAYVLTRSSNTGYASYQSDAEIVEGIGNVFPVFFFLIAALVCMTTMTRMIEEQRTQIGVMKALGYSERSIMGKYLIYSGSGAVFGCIVGFFAGSIAFPAVIWEAYSIMYTLRDLVYVYDWKLALISALVSILCSMGATMISLHKELASPAADLIRPKAPKNGKRVFLEHIGIIWNHLSFTGKVSVRNAFRYKKRFFMMIFGVAGCYALLIAGMGMKNSIADVCDCQFNYVQNYGTTVAFKDDIPLEDRTGFTDAVEGSDFIYTLCKTVDVNAEGTTKSATLVVFSDFEGGPVGSDYVNFVDLDGNAIPLPGLNEAIVSEKMARLMGLSVGDSIVLRDPDMNEMTVTISGIMKNYVYNWVYIMPETYESQMNKEIYYNTALLKNDSSELAVTLRNLDCVSSVSVNDELSVRIDSMMESVNQVVILIILCGAALAFIVMYNLTNINITERIREIATLKVLGFYPGETAMYVFRENMILTILGMGCGYFLGNWLLDFVMIRITVEVVNFDKKILPASYGYAVLLTILFAILVDLALSVKLDRIKMAESLKSVE